MATVILVRHGRTSANASGILAGRTRGVRLDETGIAQADRTAARLAVVPLAALVTSPLERCKQTVKAIAKAQADLRESAAITTERGIIECDYGDWQGRPLRDLAKEPLFRTVQSQPSAAVFPGGESMTTMQARSVTAVRRLDAAIEAEHGPSATWVAVSHGDIIKSVLADALGMHLDLFQRIHVDPASVSIIRYTDSRPYVIASNTHDGDLSWMVPPKKTRRRSAKGTAKSSAGRSGEASEAAIGGGAGPGAGPGTTAR